MVHDGEQQPAEGSELLNSFNVATFRAEEDDAAFWNRLIPVTERPKQEAAAVPEQLGIRSTRYRGGDEVRLLQSGPRDKQPALKFSSCKGREAKNARSMTVVMTRLHLRRSLSRDQRRASGAGEQLQGAVAERLGGALLLALQLMELWHAWMPGQLTATSTARWQAR